MPSSENPIISSLLSLYYSLFFLLFSIYCGSDGLITTQTYSIYMVCMNGLKPRIFIDSLCQQKDESSI